MSLVSLAMRGSERRHTPRPNRALSTTSSLQVQFSDSEDEAQANEDLTFEGGASAASRRNVEFYRPQQANEGRVIRHEEEEAAEMQDSDVDSTSSPNTSQSNMTRETNQDTSALHRVRHWLSGNRQR